MKKCEKCGSSILFGRIDLHTCYPCRIKEEYLKKKYVKPKTLKLIKECKKTGKRLNKEDISYPMNNYDRKLLYPFYSNKLLIETVEYFISQTFGEFRRVFEYETSDIVYNDSLKHRLIHLMLDKMKEFESGEHILVWYHAGIPNCRRFASKEEAQSYIKEVTKIEGSDTVSDFSVCKVIEESEVVPLE